MRHYISYTVLKGLAQAKIIKKSVILFRVLNIWLYDVNMYKDNFL